MKNLLLIFLTTLTVVSFAQVRVLNSTDSKATIMSLNGHEEVVINPKSSAYVHFLPADGLAEFKLGRYDGFKHVSLGIAKRQTSKGRMALRNFELEDNTPAKLQKAEKEPEKVKESFSPAQTDYSNQSKGDQDFWSETTLVAKNESSVRVLALAYPFKGMALEAEQASAKSITLGTGVYTFPVYYDPEPDSLSTGRLHKWSVISKIVVEGQDTLRITDNDLREVSSGVQIQKVVRNYLPIDFLIVAYENQGKVIPANGMMKLDLRVGWNVIPVQYLNKKNMPVQAVLLLMINDQKRKPIFADKKNGENTVSIEPDNLVLFGR